MRSKASKEAPVIIDMHQEAPSPRIDTNMPTLNTAEKKDVENLMACMDGPIEDFHDSYYPTSSNLVNPPEI